MLHIICHQKMQMKTMLKYYHTPVRMAKFKTITPPNAGDNVKQQELSFTACGNTKWHCVLEDSLAVTDKLNICLPYDPKLMLSDIYPKEVQAYYPHQNLHPYISSSFIHDF